MSMIPVIFEGRHLEAQPDSKHEFLMTTREVAEGYGVKTRTIRDHKHLHADELSENRHFISRVEKIDAGNLQQKQTLWTKRGIIRLGFFIKSERAKKFRDFIEDLSIAVDRNIIEQSDGQKDLFTVFEQGGIAAQARNDISADLLTAQTKMIAELVKKLEDSYERIITAQNEAIEAQKTAIESQRLAMAVANNYVSDKAKTIYVGAKPNKNAVTESEQRYMKELWRNGQGLTIAKIAHETQRSVDMGVSGVRFF